MLWYHMILISHVYHDGNDGHLTEHQNDVLGFTTLKCIMN